VYELSVKGVNDSGNSAVSAGDQLYYVDNDIGDGSGFLSKKNSGYFFGFALEAVSSGSTSTIKVLVLPSPGPGTADILSGAIGTDELADDALAASVAGRAKMADGFFDATAALAKFATDSMENAFLIKAIADGAFQADATTRALFADAIWTVAKLAVPKVNVISQQVAIGDFTDNEDATGYVDLATQLPKGAVPLATKFVVTTGFTGDTTATVQAGVSGDLDRFTEQTDQSVLAAGTVGSTPPADCCDGIGAAQTIRITVTGSADFSNISAGEMTVYVYYIETE